MASTTIQLSGKAKWARPYNVDQWGNFKTQLYLDPESLDKFHELKKDGLATQLNSDEEGEYITCKRPASKVMNGKIVTFAPPEVLEANGKTPFRGAIGDGSDITCQLEVYSYTPPMGMKTGKRAKAMRLQSIRVDNLVPFEVSHFTPKEEEMVSKQREQPRTSYVSYR